MGDTTEISWCDKTFNPWEGCRKVSPACKNCYAETRAKRFHTDFSGARILRTEDYWRQPLKWNRTAEKTGTRPRVFCASLADVFEDWNDYVQDHEGRVLGICRECQTVEPQRASCSKCKSRQDDYSISDVRLRLFSLIDATPNLDWLLLTKRPENILKMWPYRVSDYGQDSDNRVIELLKDRDRTKALNYRPNVLIGTSVENSDYLHRIDTLKSCGDLAGKLFLSVEPLLGPLPTIGEHIDGIDWVIVGGESGPHSRPMNPDWVRSIRDQCETHGVAFHLKQWGQWVPYEHRGSPPLLESQHGFNFDRHGLPEGIIDHEPVKGWYWPDGLSDVVYRSVGKKIAGRKLDDVTHDAFP